MVSYCIASHTIAPSLWRDQLYWMRTEEASGIGQMYGLNEKRFTLFFRSLWWWEYKIETCAQYSCNCDGPSRTRSAVMLVPNINAIAYDAFTLPEKPFLIYFVICLHWYGVPSPNTILLLQRPTCFDGKDVKIQIPFESLVDNYDIRECTQSLLLLFLTHLLLRWCCDDDDDEVFCVPCLGRTSYSQRLGWNFSHKFDAWNKLIMLFWNKWIPLREIDLWLLSSVFVIITEE